jgi:hypothetical protein
MAYTGQQRYLLQAAEKYTRLGYKIGFAKAKEFLGGYQETTSTVMTFFGPTVVTGQEPPDGFDGVSIIPEGIVCVDFDINDFGVIWEPCPPTWKERTPRGWHLWYRLPIAEMVHGRTYRPKIKWRPHVDLLTKTTANNVIQTRRAPYGGKKANGSVWGEHVLVSPTSGYTRIWPADVPALKDLTEAPQWLVDELSKET